MDAGFIKIERNKGKTEAKHVRERMALPLTQACPGLSIEDREIIKAVMDARDEWIETSNNFEHVCDEMLVDYYVYKLKACESRYSYFVKQAKKRGLSSHI